MQPRLAVSRMLFDSFCHFYTKEYLDQLRNSCPAITLVGPEPNSDRIYIVDSRLDRRVDIGFLRSGSGFDNIDRRLRDMEHFGIDMQALSIATPGIDTELLHVSPKETVRIAKAINDSLASISKKHPDKFVAIAEVPILQIDEALEEFDRAINTLGMRGVQVYTTVGGLPLDSPQFRPFFERAAKLDVPVLIHPTYPPSTQRRSYEMDYELQMIYVWPFETTLCISRLVFSGIFEEFPNLKIVTHHSGAMVPFFGERIRSVYKQGRKGGLKEQSKMKKDPLEYFKLMYHDTSIYGSVAALNCTAAVMGPERMIYSTDYPYGPEDGLYFLRATKESVEKMNVTEEERETIYGGNAMKIFKL